MEKYQLIVRTTLLFLMLSGNRSSTNIYVPNLSESNLISYHLSSIKMIFLFTKVLFTKIYQLCFFEVIVFRSNRKAIEPSWSHRISGARWKTRTMIQNSGP